LLQWKIFKPALFLEKEKRKLRKRKYLAVVILCVFKYKRKGIKIVKFRFGEFIWKDQ